MVILRDVVTRATLFSAFVERQKERVITGKPGSHVDLILADGEVHQRAALEGQQRLRLVGLRIFWQARFFVLVYGAVDRLLEFGFQFESGNGKAVDKQHQVDAPAFGFCIRGIAGGVRAVDQFRDDTANVLPIARKDVRVEVVIRLELA